METIKKIFGKLGDIVAVSAWFFVCCIPVFTIGASVSALYYAVNKSVCNNRGYVSQEFFRSFKNNFKVTTLGWFIHLALLVVFTIDFYLAGNWQVGWSRILFMALFVILIFAVMSWIIYFQAYVARFDDGLKLGLINAGKLALAGFAKTILLTLLFVAFFAACIYFFPAVLLLPGIYGLIAVKILEPAFRKVMSEEDLALENERNQIWS